MTARPRRRVGFRKGADVDEELWPAESFGGVSDEQFWDDMASDKPLTTTARTAQQDPGSRNRPFDAVPPPSAAKHTATQPTATQPTVARPTVARPTATQAVQRMTPKVPGAPRPVRSAASTGPMTSASQPMTSASQPMTSASQPMNAAQPAEARGRRRARRSDDEDPLTSAAFSLRSSGPVDGRSSRRSRDMPREQYDATVTQETQTFSAAETEAASSGYPGGVPSLRQSESSANGRSPSSYSGTSYGDPSSVTQAMITPPYGENYGYGSGGSPTQPAQPDDPRRQNGTRSHGRHGGTSEAGRTAWQAYSQDGYQDTGGYQGSGSQSGGYPTSGYPLGGYPTGGYPTGGYPDGGHQTGAHQANANAYRSNGHRAPYDPQEDYRRLTHLG